MSEPQKKPNLEISPKLKRQPVGVSPRNFTVTVTVKNESSFTVGAGGKVTLQHQDSGETCELVFPLIPRGSEHSEACIFTNGLPDKGIYRFIPVEDPQNFWFDLLFRPEGIPGLNLHLQD